MSWKLSDNVTLLPGPNSVTLCEEHCRRRRNEVTVSHCQLHLFVSFLQVPGQHFNIPALINVDCSCHRTADADRAFLMVWFHKMFVCHAQDLRGDLLKQGLK